MLSILTNSKEKQKTKKKSLNDLEFRNLILYTHVSLYCYIKNIRQSVVCILEELNNDKRAGAESKKNKAIS